MSELPRGWVEVTLDDVCDLITDGTHHSPSNGPIGEFKYVTAKNIRRHGLDLTKITFVDRETHQKIYMRCPVRKGDVLYIKDGATTGLAIVNPLGEEFSMLSSVALIRPAKLLNADFLKCQLNSPELFARMTGDMTGSAIRRLTLTTIGRQQISVPTLPEQKRIVAKLDALSARSARARKDLAHIDILVKQGKRAVLSNAFSGKLTENWRADEPAQGSECMSLDSLGLSEVERGDWNETKLPTSWSWDVFTNLFEDLTDSRRKLPQRSYVADGKYPVVDQGVRQIGGYTNEESLVHTCDPPVVVFGDHTRCVKRVDHNFVQGADGVKVLKPKERLDFNYAYWSLVAIELPDKGYSRHMKFLKASAFPVAPAKEQREIVRRIESAFKKIDRMAAEAKRALFLVDKLDEAILAKAFQGELVPQDPNNEPASVLLDRIKAERAAAPKAKRGRRAKS